MTTPAHTVRAEAHKLHKAGYSTVGLNLSYDPVTQKKNLHFKPNWQLATTETCLNHMFTDGDQALALVCGPASDVLAVDLDQPKPRDIQEGLSNAVDAVKALIHQHGLHPSTPIAHTPSGGMHLIFKLSSTLEAGLQSAANAAKCAGMTMDCRGDKGCIIIYPSSVPYPDGSKQYVWQTPLCAATDLLPAPGWLIHLLNQRSKKRSSASTLEPGVIKRQRQDECITEDQEAFSLQLQSDLYNINPILKMGKTWPRTNGCDFAFCDRTCSCPNCGNIHTSNHFKARMLVDPTTFTLCNYSTSCFTRVYGWEDNYLIKNLIGSPQTDDPFCYLLKALFLLQKRNICFTAAKRFLSFNGTVWEPIHPQYLKQDIKMIANHLILPLLAGVPKTEETAPKLKALSAAKKYLEKSHNVSSIMATFETICFNGEIEDQLDTEPDLLAVGNGVLNLRTGIVSQGVPFQNLATQISVDLHMEQPTPLIDSFFNSIFNDDKDTISYMQRLLGYGVTGHTREQVWSIWTGSGSNGKSLLMDILKQLLGPFAVMMPAELLFETGKTTAGASTPHLQTLINKRIGFKDESKADKANVLNEELIKTVTGSSTITTRPLYRDFVEFRPTHLPILLCNKKPRLNILDTAMLRRIVVVEFPNKYTARDAKQDPYDESDPTHRIRDDGLLERLLSEDGQQQLLTWLAHGAKAWYEHGLGAMPEQIGKAFDAYKEENDTLATFIAESCVVDVTATVNAKQFLDAYNSFSGVTIKQKTLKELMASKNFKYATNGVYRGLHMTLN